MRRIVALVDCAGSLGAENPIQFPPISLYLLFWLIIANFLNEVFEVFLQIVLLRNLVTAVVRIQADFRIIGRVVAILKVKRILLFPVGNLSRVIEFSRHLAFILKCCKFSNVFVIFYNGL